jgi:hypothetical protein
MQYLVEATGGPGFASPSEALAVLENAILPGFDALVRMEAEKTILAGGLRVGERAFAFIIEAADNAEADQIVRGIPFWPVLQWRVTALQSFSARAAIERATVAALKGGKP